MSRAGIAQPPAVLLRPAKLLQSLFKPSEFRASSPPHTQKIKTKTLACFLACFAIRACTKLLQVLFPSRLLGQLPLMQGSRYSQKILQQQMRKAVVDPNLHAFALVIQARLDIAPSGYTATASRSAHHDKKSLAPSLIPSFWNFVKEDVQSLSHGNAGMERHFRRSAGSDNSRNVFLGSRAIWRSRFRVVIFRELSHASTS